MDMVGEMALIEAYLRMGRALWSNLDLCME